MRFVPLVLALTATLSHSAPHSLTGGVGGIVRANYTTVGTTTDPLGTPSINIPAPTKVYLLPLSVLTFDEGAPATLQPDGTLLVTTSGLYRVSMAVDWGARYGTDIGLRKYGIGRLAAGQTFDHSRIDGGLWNITGSDYDRLAMADMPGSNPPIYTRASAAWAPGPLAAGATTYLDIPLPGVALGDLVQAAFTSDLGALDLTARIVAPGLARVILTNRGTFAATLLPGTVNVLSGTAVALAGHSTDGWHMVNTPTVLLYAGERVFGTIKSEAANDFIQITNMTFLQIELWAPLPAAKARGARHD